MMKTNTEQTTTGQAEAVSPRISRDTMRSIKSICKNGYYGTTTTLGVGGWPALYEQIGNDWKTYRLYACEEGTQFIDKITAKDDKTAIKAFRDKYDFTNLADWHIDEEIRRNRTIAQG